MANALRVLVVGGGKVGTTLARELGRRRLLLRHLPARGQWPTRALAADLVVVAVRDPDLSAMARKLARSGVLDQRCRPAAVHCSGARGPEALAPLRALGMPIAQMHPLLAFAAAKRPPRLAGAWLHVAGDRAAVRRARALGRALGMRTFSVPGLPRDLYHAAAALVSNGAAALVWAGARLLRRAGVPARALPDMLGHLLGSVADNVTQLGVPEALTGPARRGDVECVARHCWALGQSAPDLLPLYALLLGVQADMALDLGEAEHADIGAMRSLASELAGPAFASGRSGNCAIRRKKAHAKKSAMR
jgi:predicted short-subunit dehydrogenase-like oxidoreductase (DUF2520 family)